MTATRIGTPACLACANNPLSWTCLATDTPALDVTNSDW